MMNTINQKNNQLLGILALIFISLLIFRIFPNLDIKTSQLFFSKCSFHLKKNPVLVIISYSVFSLPLCCFVFCLYSFSKKGSVHSFNICNYKKELFLFLLIIIGILLMVPIMKPLIARPRPFMVEEFYGHLKYAPIFSIPGECKKNCSFVSHHASISFLAIALTYAINLGRSFKISAVAYVFIISITRIMQGKHFLSDVIFAVLFMALLSEILKLIINRVTWYSPDKYNKTI